MGRVNVDVAYHSSVSLDILEALDTPRALTVAIMVRHEMWDEIATLTIRPQDYPDAVTFFRAYQATKLLSKAKWMPTSFDKRKVAILKFEQAELACRETNHLFDRYLSGEIKLLRNYERLLFVARRKIGNVLGDQLYRWTEFCDFGPGADGSTVAGLTSAYNKLTDSGSITGGAYPLFECMVGLTSLQYLIPWNISTRKLDITFLRGNKVTFVPKNAKTDRSIAVEPRWNMFMQKGVGRYLRYRLKHFGVDLDDQSVNQQRALSGSETGRYATIDLSSASDTVSRGLVEALLPLPWSNLLDSLRSKEFKLNGVWRSYEKWSSMGNGYTFELESLLFWALASSVNEDVSIYGDDLVVPSESYDTIVDLLGLCGFSVNSEKSFSIGPFRESCGLDAFDGKVTTPIYWKEPLDDQGSLSLVNQICLLSTILGSKEFRFLGLKKVWKRLVYKLPKRFQQRGPTTISTVVHDSSFSWNASRRFGWDGVHLNIWLPVARKHRYTNYEAAVISQNFQPFSDGYSVRGRVVWKKRTVFVPCGYEDLGPWE